jgi:hypothetical protein
VFLLLGGLVASCYYNFSLQRVTKNSQAMKSYCLVRLLEKEKGHDQLGVLSTVCGYMSDDGFTMVQRKYKQKRARDKISAKTSRANANGHGTNSVSKDTETAKANEGNKDKRGHKWP